MEPLETEPLPRTPVHELPCGLLELSDDEIYDFFEEILQDKNIAKKHAILTVLEKVNLCEGGRLPARETTFAISMQEWQDQTIRGGSTSDSPLRYIEEQESPLIAVYDISQLAYIHLIGVEELDAAEHISTNELKHKSSSNIQDALVCVFTFGKSYEQ